MEYATGHVKRNTETGAVAVRTVFPDDDASFLNMAWLVATVGVGAINSPTSSVEAWEDLFVPAADG
jgi:hypothetical protein